MRSMESRAAVLLSATLLLAPGAAEAQDELSVPNIHFGVTGVYGRPVGEFHDYVKHGGGLNLSAVLSPPAGGAFGLRADGGFIIYGSETQEVCFSSTVGCRVRLDLTTTNSIAYLNVGPQLMLPGGTLRPYANAGIGFAYFGTSSSVSGVDNDDSFGDTTNFDDITFGWTGGGGLLVQLSRGRTPVALDLGVRYMGNGEAEYLKKGDIQDNPDGSITFTPTRSEANLLQFQVGVSIGARAGMN